MRMVIAGLLTAIALAVFGLGVMVTYGLGAEYGFGFELLPVVVFTVAWGSAFGIPAVRVYSASKAQSVGGHSDRRHQPVA